MSRVILAMSGGVDSSVAACLLQKAGHEVIGLFMRHGQADTQCEVPSGHKQGCCSEADATDARRVADRLGIPFYALNFEEQFERIIDYFVDEYTAARTPNPCIVCNTWLKFGQLFRYADSVGAEFVATGHYACLKPVASTSCPLSTVHCPLTLCRAHDPGKDQSYVLFGIRRELLPRLMFPVGEYPKAEIRRMAAEWDLRVADKPDSQEICFIPDHDHARFVRSRRPNHDSSGDVVLTDGTIVGHHDGLERFTIGQRKGLGLAFGEPRYVVRLDIATRQVVLGTRAELARTELTAAEANWLIDEPRTAFFCHVKIRYRSRPVPAQVEPLPGGRFAVHFQEPCEGVAPGQAAVCYDGTRVLGGGWIE